MKMKKAVSTTPVGLKCEARSTCLYRISGDSTRYVSVCEILHTVNVYE